ncbi:MAG: ABC transporter substrate-binding protein [Planctomycetes bacterium]|nr:ABC transporter substrate-binding protein [Planctomycetota bacterium]
MRLVVVVPGLAIAGLLALGWLVVWSSPTPSATTGELLPQRVHPQGDAWRSATTPIPSLNVFTTRDAVGVRLVLAFTHEPLVDRDPATGDPRPCAAESWQSDAEQRSWRFELRPGLRFADGAPVTREDLEFTVRMARDPRVEPKSDMCEAIAGLAAMTVEGERTLVMTSTVPDPEFPLRLGTQVRIVQAAFHRREVGARAPTAEPFDDEWLRVASALLWSGPGTGPYAIALRADGSPDWSLDEYLALTVNRFGWQRAARPGSWNLAGFQLRFLPDESARIAALKRGEIDWFTTGSGDDLAVLRASDPLLAERYRVLVFDPPHMGHVQVLWNCRVPGLDRAEVRRALGMLFDRESIAREVFGGQARVARGWFRPSSPEYPDESAAPRFSIDEARALLASVGFGPGGRPLRIEILCPSGAPMLRRIAEFAVPAFQAAGVELVLVHCDYASAYARQTKHDFEALLGMQYHDAIIDPHDFFALAGNDMGWRCERAEALLLAARRESTAPGRIARYREFERLLAEEQPVSVIVHPRTQVLLHARLRGAEAGPLGISPELFWVEPAEQIVRARGD